MLKFPNNKKFIFTIIDDTDDAFLENIKPIYDVLNDNNLKTTKTVWVYPPRDLDNSKGDCLQRVDYVEFILSLIKNGFEIGLHNVGSGSYSREEIIKGLGEFKKILGFTPNLHINHSYNPDNVYSGIKRFGFPINWAIKNLYPIYHKFYGDDPNSNHFWGDYHKKLIKYGRNYEFDNINTFKINPFMPYKDKKYDMYSNYWFSSTFAPNQWMFNKLVTPANIDRLEKEGGICILYTHLGYYMQNQKIDKGFIEKIKYIGSKNTGWFIPVSQVLDFLIEHKKKNNIPEYLPKIVKKKLELKSIKTRIKYRYIKKIDDFHFKKSKDYVE
jgi:hypothetical protein